ncbi:MAG: radical SAM protein [Fimbriimonadaceae bacterium]|nr:radical SAM protein [Fimbriimonadaceae bacterium]
MIAVSPPPTEVLPNDPALLEFARFAGCATLDELLYFPKYFQLETSALCNSRCTMCYLDSMQRPKGLMRDELFEQIVAELAQYADWINKITIQNLGEPLVDKKLEQRIARLKEIGIAAVAFSTNGTLLTPQRAESVLQAGCDEVSFSIDAATAETYEPIRVGLSFEQAVARITGFIETRNRLGAACAVRVRMCVQESNAHEYAAWVDFWKPRLGPGDSLYGKLLHKMDGATVQHVLPVAEPRGDLNTRPCTGPFGSLIICQDGRLSLCPVDCDADQGLGRVQDASIAELWRGAVLSEVRLLHRAVGRQGRAMCVDCNLWDHTSRLPGYRRPA